jgi:hypothetical protein
MAFVTAALQLASAGVSTYQAIEANRRIKDAQRAAQKATREAKRLTEINPMQELSVPTEAYMQARESQQRLMAQQVQAAQEADPRGAARSAGVAVGGSLALEDQLRSAQEMMQYRRDIAVKGQDVANIDARRAIAEAEASGSQQAAADSQEAKAEAITSGAEMLAGVGATIDAGQALYKQSRDAKMIGKELGGDQRSQFLAQTTPILRQQMAGMTAGQREQFARQYGLDLDTMQTALGDGGNFGDFFGSLGGLTQQELLGQVLTNDQIRAAKNYTPSNQLSPAYQNATQASQGSQYQGIYGGLAAAQQPWWMNPMTGGQ